MKPFARFFLFGIALSLLNAGTAFAALIDANIHFVWMRNEDARGEFFVKPSDYKKMDGALKSLSREAQKFRGENPIAIYKKNANGNYAVCGKIEIPAGVRNCAVILVPDWEMISDSETAFRPKVLNLEQPKIRGGELVFCNLSSLTLRARIRGNEPEKYLPDEIRKLYAIPVGEESNVFSFKILAAATDAKAAKRSWRYGNSMRIVRSQRYYLVALPGEPKDDPEKPPQCELITLRTDAK